MGYPEWVYVMVGCYITVVLLYVSWPRDEDDD